jgi:ATP-dependent exoDNAse (exonuclease V) beta subunit
MTLRKPAKRKPHAHNPDQLALAFDDAASELAGWAEELPADHAERRRALDPTRSFIVQAPAGSGKTGLLIQRYLKLLAAVETPEQVLAITFTIKAAGEMRARVLQALRAAAAGEVAQSAHERLAVELGAAVLAADRSGGWDLASNPDRMQIHTIDALCVGLNRRLPLLSGLGPLPAIEENPLELYREAARETLALLEEPEHTERVAALLWQVDNDFGAAENMLAHLLQQRDQWARHVVGGGVDRAALEAALGRLVSEALEEALEAAPDVFVPAILETVRYAARNLVAAVPGAPLARCVDLVRLPGMHSGDLPLWRAIAGLLLTDDGVRRRFDVGSGFPPPSKAQGVERSRREQAKLAARTLMDELVAHEAFVAALQAIRKLPEPRYDESQWRFIEALAQLLPYAAAQLQLVFRRSGAVDFVETTLGAIQALGDPDAPNELLLALDYRIQHVLVDEFQDTSVSQFQLLRCLTAGWQPGDGRTLFLVGDPMQSIYRFREAEVGLFLRARRAGIEAVPLEPLALSVNFRSQAGVVEWVNEVFEQVLPAREDIASGAVPYSPGTASVARLPGPAVAVHPLLGEHAEAEARIVVELVRRAMGDEPGGSVAVLVRNRSHLSHIVPALKQAGLPFRAIDIDPLAGRSAVRDLYALTRALVHLADRTAWLAVLRAPWCGLALRDIEALVGGERKVVLWQRMLDPQVRAGLSAAGAARLERCVQALAPAMGNRGRGPLRRRVEAAWMALGGPACAQDVTEVDDAMAYLDLLDTLEAGGDLADCTALDARLGELYALPDVLAPDSLQIMTIHKAKGLQFDVVIVPGLGRPPRGDEPQLLQWLERARGDHEPELLLAAITAQGGQKDPIYECVTRLHAERQRHEDARLLYVAVTRARKRVHLLGHTRLDAATTEARPPDKRSLLARLWPTLAPLYQAAAAHTAASGAAAAVPPASAPVPRIQRLRASWTRPAPPPNLQWEATHARTEQELLADIEFSWVGETARHVGTVVHLFLQRMAEEGPAAWSPGRVQSLAGLVRAALRSHGVPAAELTAATARVQQALSDMLLDARARWVLGGGQREARSEYRLAGELDGEFVHIAIDRTFVDEHDVRWIVDYKTSTHEGAGLESFLDRERERYRAQLEGYARLLARTEQRRIRLGLYFPLLRAWREWEAGGQPAG